MLRRITNTAGLFLQLTGYLLFAVGIGFVLFATVYTRNGAWMLTILPCFIVSVTISVCGTRLEEMSC